MQLLKLVTGAMMLSSCSLMGIGSQEQPKYIVVEKEGNKEIRKYKSYIVAKTVINGTYKEAQKTGFRVLAGYIFGKNKSKKKISMTSPVVINNKLGNEKIEMTAPVTITPNKISNYKDSWVISFSMPSKYSLKTLPIPDDKRIILELVPERYVASYKFSGFWNESINEKKAEKLFIWLKKNKKYIIDPVFKFAGYNPPWTLPFLRRNEILIDLELKNI